MGWVPDRLPSDAPATWSLTRRAWATIVGVTIAVATLTWVGLNVGRMVYQDWAFLHAIRMATEAQAAQQQRGAK